DEGIDRRARPISAAYGRRRGCLKRLKRPVPAPLLEVETLRSGGGHAGRGAWPGRSHPDPGDQGGDLGVRPLGLGRHAQFGVLVADGLEEQALVRFARHNGGAGIAALEQAGSAVELKVGLLLLASAMARVAVLDQHRSDLLLEKLLRVRSSNRTT